MMTGRLTLLGVMRQRYGKVMENKACRLGQALFSILITSRQAQEK